MNRLLTAVVAAAAFWAAACSSGGGSVITPPPPTGNFTNASLNGTYAFVTSGEVCASNPCTPTSFARTGSFTADGAGGIKTGGVYDLVNAGGMSTTSSQPIPIVGGSYTVKANGRGTLTLNVTSSGGPATINFGIVLTSTSDGLMIDETTTGQASTGSGNFILQNAAAFGISNISGPYVFDFSGLDATQPPNGPNPESLIGQFNATNAGTITTGFEDANDAGALNSASMAPGTLTADPANMATSGRGTAVIEGQSYAFYIVDANRVRFISINSTGFGPMLTGDAVLQSNIPANLSAINGGFAFIVGGSDSSGNGLIRVGRFTVSGSAVSKVLLDVNDAAVENEYSSFTNPSITYDPTTGRGVVSFQASTLNVFSFVFYLSSASSGVIQDVSPSDTTSPASEVADGSLALQSGNPFTASNITGPYAMNWSGVVTSNGSQGEEDLLAQANISNLNLSGTSDIFQFTTVTLTTNIGTAGSINFNGGDGTGDDGKPVFMTVSLSNVTPIHMVVYIVNPQLAFFANRDNSDAPRIVAGILKAQQ